MPPTVDEFLNQKNHLTDALNLIEQKTGIPRKYSFYAVAGGALFAALYFIFGYASTFIVGLVGFVYPAYCSVKAIESDQKDDDTQWLTYWVVYSAFSLAEIGLDIVIGWLPLYFLFKCGFLFWCMAPFSWNGSNFIYSKFIQPFIKKHEKKLDELIDQAKDQAEDLMNAAESKVKDVAGDLMKGDDKKDD